MVGALAPADQEQFRRLYRVSTEEAKLSVPELMVPWVERQFGDVETVESQRIIRVMNKVTGEGTLFNGLRAQRPLQAPPDSGPPTLDMGDDLLAKPLETTPEDPFGRVASEYGVTAANIAKYDALHSLVVFQEANPLAFTRQSLGAHLDLATRWVGRAHGWDPNACYPYIIWNCLWRAGGSLLHGHFQMALARGMHYSRIERLRADAEFYRHRTGANYFQDLAAVHLALGCGGHLDGISVMAHLTPIRDKEVLVLAPRLDDGAVDVVYRVLEAFRDILGVRSFNMGVVLPPVAPVAESWEGFPVMIRLVDRGSLENRSSDVAGMELFAESVVASDPFAVARTILSAQGWG
jgi:hypothetical protein